MGIVSYEGFASNHTSMTNTINEMQETLTSTSKLLDQLLNDESKGQWAASKASDWAPLAQRISKNLERMQTLMDAAAQGNAGYAQWEQEHSGFNA